MTLFVGPDIGVSLRVNPNGVSARPPSEARPNLGPASADLTVLLLPSDRLTSVNPGHVCRGRRAAVPVVDEIPFIGSSFSIPASCVASFGYSVSQSDSGPLSRSAL